MLFTLVCVVLVLAVLAAVSLPLLSGAHVLPTRGQYDRAVYRDQLQEVDRDVARGVLGPREADSARLEIQRRLLAVDISGGPVADQVTRSPRMAATVALFVGTECGRTVLAPWRAGVTRCSVCRPYGRPAGGWSERRSGSAAPGHAGRRCAVATKITG